MLSEKLNDLNPFRVSLGIVLWMFLMLLPGTFQLPLLDRDEPRFSRATVEMMERSDWVVPTFNGNYRFDKPPLTYWWMAVHYKLFGFNEFAARFHSVLSSIGVGLLIFWWVRKIIDQSTAVGAVFGWSICLQNLMHGRLALADMPMILMLVATHWALWHRLTGPAGKRFDRIFWLMWVSMGVGFLAKGPIAVFFPAVTVLCYRYLFRKPVEWSSLQVFSGACVTLAIIAAWGLPALLSTGGAYWDEGMGTHVIDRGFKSFNDRIIIPGFYAPASLLSLFPLFPVILIGIVHSVRRRDDIDAFMLSWAIGPFLIFSFYATQLIHYTLPAFPALMVIGFRGGDRYRRQWKPFQTIYGAAFLLAGMVALGAWLWVLTMDPSGKPSFAADGKSLFSGYLLAIAVVLLSLQGIWYFWHRNPGPAAVIGSATALAVAMVYAAHHSRSWGLSRKIGSVLEAIPAEITPAAIGYREPSLVFYGKRNWDLSHGDDWSDLQPGQPVVTKMFELQIEDFLKGMVRGFEDITGETIPDSALQRALRTVRANTGSRNDAVVFIRGINFARMSLVEAAIILQPEELIPLIQEERGKMVSAPAPQ